jgi:hypothetical protein
VWYIAFRDKRIWKILKKLEKTPPQSKMEQKFYISGFWDADGGCPRVPRKDKKLYIDFTQKDKHRLIELKNFLERFKIKCGNIRICDNTKDKPIWRFSITGKNDMLKFCNEIGSLHPEKKLRLEKIKSILEEKLCFKKKRKA